MMGLGVEGRAKDGLRAVRERERDYPESPSISRKAETESGQTRGGGSSGGAKNWPDAFGWRGHVRTNTHSVARTCLYRSKYLTYTGVSDRGPRRQEQLDWKG